MSRILDGIVIRFGDWLCTHRLRKPYSTLGQLIKTLYLRYENHNYNIAKNGEERILKLISQYSPQVVFDVGANVGDWSLAANMKLDAEIHSFEIVEETFNHLKKNTTGISNIKKYNLGFDETDGKVELKIVSKSSSISAYPRAETQKVISKQIGEVVSLDNFILKNNINRIDLLKIDTEGMDYRILKGASEALDKGLINVIQFEYGMVSVETRFLLKDFFMYLESKNFTVGKIYPTYVDFRKYERAMEDFIGPNFLAVKNDLHQMIDQFRNG